MTPNKPSEQREIISIAELKPDSKNANKHSERGSAMVSKSLSKYGAGRSILLDRSNNIIAGNLTAEEAGQIGMQDVQIVESDGTKLIAVKRTDVDLDSEQTLKKKSIQGNFREWIMK